MRRYFVHFVFTCLVWDPSVQQNSTGTIDIEIFIESWKLQGYGKLNITTLDIPEGMAFNIATRCMELHNLTMTEHDRSIYVWRNGKVDSSYHPISDGVDGCNSGIRKTLNLSVWDMNLLYATYDEFTGFNMTITCNRPAAFSLNGTTPVYHPVKLSWKATLQQGDANKIKYVYYSISEVINDRFMEQIDEQRFDYFTNETGNLSLPSDYRDRLYKWRTRFICVPEPCPVVDCPICPFGYGFLYGHDAQGCDTCICQVLTGGWIGWAVAIALIVGIVTVVIVIIVRKRCRREESHAASSPTKQDEKPQALPLKNTEDNTTNVDGTNGDTANVDGENRDAA